MNPAERSLQLPWHKAGIRLDNVRTAREAMHIAGLNWTVAKKKNPAAKTPPLPLPYVAVREDLWNGSDRQEGILAYTLDDYVPVQNVDVFEFFDAIIDTGAVFYESAGSDENGLHVWIMARLSGDLSVLPGDIIARFVKLSYFHGNPAITNFPRIALIPLRIRSCRELAYLWSEKPFLSIDALEYQLVPVPMDSNGRPRLQQSPSATLKVISKEFNRIADQFRKMTRLQLTERRRKNTSDPASLFRFVLVQTVPTFQEKPLQA